MSIASIEVIVLKPAISDFWPLGGEQEMSCKVNNDKRAKSCSQKKKNNDKRALFKLKWKTFFPQKTGN